MDRSKGQLWTPRRTHGAQITLLEGRGRIVDAQGKTLWRAPDWSHNSLTYEGEDSILDTWLREATHLPKFLVLLAYPTVDVLPRTANLATMRELFEVTQAGYIRQPVLATDWQAPVLNRETGMMEVVAQEKAFGPATALWKNFTHVALIAVGGGGGKLLLAIPLGAVSNLAPGLRFLYTLRLGETDEEGRRV